MVQKYLYLGTDFRSAFAMAAKKSAAQAQIYTAVPVTKYTADWTIENFLTLAKTFTPGSVLNSPEFEIKFVSNDSKLMITKWHFECHPSVKNNQIYGSRYVYLYIHVSKQTPCPSGTKVSAKFSLGTSKSWNSPFCDINSSDSRVGHWYMFTHEDMIAHPKDYLIEDKLCIKCDISIMLEDCVRSYACNSLTDFSPLRLELSDINAKAKDRQAWQDLKANTVVDLGPSLVTIAFGDEGTEEACHTFPLAARSPVFRKMLTVDMLEKASGRVEMPHISPATGRQCSELFCFLITRRKRRYGIGLHPLYRNSK